MSEFKGRIVNVGLAPQTSYSTAVTTPEYTIPWMTVTLKDVIETLQNESAFGNIAHYNDSIVSGVHGEGEISTKLWHKGLYYFLLWIFGQAPTKTATGTGYKYTFTMANHNQHLAQTVSIAEPNDPGYFPTALLNEATIAWTPSDFATLTASLISKKFVSASAFTAAYAADDVEFKPSHLEFKVADSVSGLDSATAATLFTSVSLGVTKNAEGEQTSDSGVDYGTFTNGALEATLSLERHYSDTTYKELALAGTAKSVSFGFVDSDNLASTGVPTSLQFILPKVKLTSRDMSLGLDDTATETIEATALFDASEGALMTAELITKYDYS